ncbi:hypothetical protein B5M09_000062 [Aphanomyces astaci]|uniref:Uncharacterized protein n=1 Tax=Aphanomyces astaci TaxID=112090 RepID=A0A3R7XWU7_APHAT|nr:hypothetical protein B5M09_000062 [Aphanomyces astaci]
MSNLWKEIVLGIGLALVGVICTYRIYKHPRNSPHDLQVPFRAANWWLMLFRIASCSFFVVVWSVQMHSTNWFNLVYYTYWNFTLQTIYFGAAIVDQVRRWIRSNDANHANWPLNTLFDVAMTSSLLVGLVYWCLLYDPSKPTEWATYIVHLANIGMLLIEFAFNEYLAQRTSLKFVILWPALFASLSWIGNATFNKGFWPYDLISLDKSMAPLIWFGIGIGHAICFGIVLLLSYAKSRWMVAATPRPAAEPPLEEHAQTPTTDADMHVELATPTTKSMTDKMHTQA